MASIIQYIGNGDGDRHCGYCKKDENVDYTFGKNLITF